MGVGERESGREGMEGGKLAGLWTYHRLVVQALFSLSLSFSQCARTSPFEAVGWWRRPAVVSPNKPALSRTHTHKHKRSHNEVLLSQPRWSTPRRPLITARPAVIGRPAPSPPPIGRRPGPAFKSKSAKGLGRGGRRERERSSAILALLKIDVYDKDGDINTEVYICTSNVNPYNTILYPENYHVQFGIILEDLQNKICT